jgi:hypothetical protein
MLLRGETSELMWRSVTDCHPGRSEGASPSFRSFASLRVTSYRLTALCRWTTFRATGRSWRRFQAIDRRHATAPELALDAVVVGESSWRLLRGSGNPGFWEGN